MNFIEKVKGLGQQKSTYDPDITSWASNGSWLHFYLHYNPMHYGFVKFAQKLFSKTKII